MVPERPPLEIASAVNKVFMMELSARPRAAVQVSAERHHGQRRSKSTIMTMARRRPTEPPPIQMALAKTGVIKRCMV